MCLAFPQVGRYRFAQCAPCGAHVSKSDQAEERGGAMKVRALLVAVGLTVLVAGAAQAEPGAAFVEGMGGAMIPVGDFHRDQHIGGAYSIAAGYEMIEFLDLMMQFTHSFNDNKNDHDRFSVDGITGESDETNQTFV